MMRTTEMTKSLLRTVRTALCALAATALASSCEHKELCYDHPHTATLTLQFDWRNAPDADPEGMCVFFYPLDDGGSVARYDFSGTEGGSLTVPTGRYRVIAYNNDTEAVLISGADHFSTHMAYTREGSALEPVYGSTASYTPKAGATDERTVICPDMMWTATATDVEIGEDGVTYTCAPVQDGAAGTFTSEERVITLYPAEIVCTYTYEIRHVENLQYVTQMCGTLAGMAPSVLLGTEELGTECVTVPFSATAEGDSTIVGRFYTFGHHEDNADPHTFVLYVWFTTGAKYYYTFDVSTQVNTAPDRRHVHIIIDNLPLPEPIGGDSGFDVNVDGWQKVEEDIVM